MLVYLEESAVVTTLSNVFGLVGHGPYAAKEYHQNFCDLFALLKLFPVQYGQMCSPGKNLQGKLHPLAGPLELKIDPRLAMPLPNELLELWKATKEKLQIEAQIMELWRAHILSPVFVRSGPIWHPPQQDQRDEEMTEAVEAAKKAASEAAEEADKKALAALAAKAASAALDKARVQERHSAFRRKVATIRLQALFMGRQARQQAKAAEAALAESKRIKKLMKLCRVIDTERYPSVTMEFLALVLGQSAGANLVHFLMDAVLMENTVVPEVECQPVDVHWKVLD